MQDWLKCAGIWWDTELLRFREAKPSDTDSAGIGLWAAKAIKYDDHLCTIPKSALLSTRNTAIADLLEAEELGGGLGLVFACMFEHARTTSSPWCDSTALPTTLKNLHVSIAVVSADIRLSVRCSTTACHSAAPFLHELHPHTPHRCKLL